jgi:hypothetical protein
VRELWKGAGEPKNKMQEEERIVLELGPAGGKIAFG